MDLRICRYNQEGRARAAWYFDEAIVDLEELHNHYLDHGGQAVDPVPEWSEALLFLPHGSHAQLAQILGDHYIQLKSEEKNELRSSSSSVELLPPLGAAGKFFLLAGNYAEHIQEGGDEAEEKAQTFPYLFWKPPGTTFRASGQPVAIPTISPDFIDWEIELGVVMGKRCKGIPAAKALDCVAGYTVVNDISNRKFRPNPNRNERTQDGFFDWLHGKWFDGFAPIGPCITSAADIGDPQSLKLKLRVHGTTHQDANTADMIFSVAEIIEFICSFVTLEPGDLISTGTPSGIGSPKGVYLHPGDVMEAEIERIGVLKTHMVSEETK